MLSTSPVQTPMTAVHDFARFKAERRKISIVTAYDAWSARLVARSNVDAILVGHAHVDIPMREVVNEQTGRTVVLCEPFFWGKRVARFDLTLKRAGRGWRVAAKKSTTLATNTVAEDPQVAVQVQAKRREVSIQCIYHWREGTLAGADDDRLLAAAAAEKLTLVTYDQKTIPPLLQEFALMGRSHGGVIFADDKTIPASDIGGLVKAILGLWEQCHSWDWTDRMVFLRPAQ